jgi:hypothetical protein
MPLIKVTLPNGTKISLPPEIADMVNRYIREGHIDLANKAINEHLLKGLS